MSASVLERGAHVWDRANVSKAGAAPGASSPAPTKGSFDEATKTAWDNKNAAANALGLGMAGSPSDGIQMEEVTRNGMTGYSAFPAYQQELQEMWRQYPERMRALNQAMPGLMDPAKDWRPAQPETAKPQQPALPYRPGMPYDFSQIANLYNRGRR